jgi:hypothetical protein
LSRFHVSTPHFKTHLTLPRASRCGGAVPFDFYFAIGFPELGVDMLLSRIAVGAAIRLPIYRLMAIAFEIAIVVLIRKILNSYTVQALKAMIMNF